jgi:hypothetical protein
MSIESYRAEKKITFDIQLNVLLLFISVYYFDMKSLVLNIFCLLLCCCQARFSMFWETAAVSVSRVAQSVLSSYGRSKFDPRQRRKDFSCRLCVQTSSLCVQTSSGLHQPSCKMGSGGPFPGVKRGRNVTLTTDPI